MHIQKGLQLRRRIKRQGTKLGLNFIAHES